MKLRSMIKAVLSICAAVATAAGPMPNKSCDSLTYAHFTGYEAANTSVLSAELATACPGGIPWCPKGPAYCLVKVLVRPSINIWVGLPVNTYNGRFQAVGSLAAIHQA